MNKLNTIPEKLVRIPLLPTNRTCPCVLQN